MRSAISRARSALRHRRISSQFSICPLWSSVPPHKAHQCGRVFVHLARLDVLQMHDDRCYVLRGTKPITRGRNIMSDHDTVLHVENEARKVLGDRAFEWMRKPSKLLDGMAPAEVATSREGAQVVLV